MIEQILDSIPIETMRAHLDRRLVDARGREGARNVEASPVPDPAVSVERLPDGRIREVGPATISPLGCVEGCHESLDRSLEADVGLPDGMDPSTKMALIELGELAGAAVRAGLSGRQVEVIARLVSSIHTIESVLPRPCDYKLEYDAEDDAFFVLFRGDGYDDTER
jgi:hypothetical protein